MPPKATLAAITVLCFGLPVAAASAFTVPDVGSRALSGVVLAQADKRLKGLRDELAKAREALQEAKKSGGDVEAAQKRVDAAQKAVQAAGKDSGARKAEGDKGEDKQRKSEGKPGDRKKAEDKQDEPRKAREKKADGDKGEDKQRKTEGKPEDKNKAEGKGDEPRKAREKNADGDKAEEKQRKTEGKPEDRKKAEDKQDEPRKAREKKAEDKKPAEQPRKAEEQKQPETEAKEAPSKAEQEAKPGDDRKRAAEEPQPDKRRFDSRDGDGDRRRRAGRDDRDGVREGEKTPAKELATKKIEEGKEAIIDGGDRVLRREGGKIVIRSDDRDRFDRGERRDERLDDGRTRVIISRPDGSQVITVRGRNGDIVRRVRRMRDGREIVIIDEDEWRRNGDRDRDRDEDRDKDRRADRDRDHRDDGDRDRRADWDRDRDHRGDWDRYRGRDRDHDFRVELGPLRITIPRERYIVESRGASRYELEEALTAPPVEPVERYYSLEDVRRSDRLRDTMRRIDVSAITFETDSAAISRSQIDALEELGYVLGSIIDRQPGELFLIEGHTDAVGSDLYNLALSDRRAESVAIALSDYFNVPPENLVTQGYGESYLKIPTPYSERENRRVTVRRITPLIRSAEQ